MLPSMTKAVHPIAAAVTAIVIVGQWCCRKARIGMQTYGFHIELTNDFSMRATACAVTSIAPARRWSVLSLLRRGMARFGLSDNSKRHKESVAIGGIADIMGFLLSAVDELTLSNRHEANADIHKPA